MKIRKGKLVGHLVKAIIVSSLIIIPCVAIHMFDSAGKIPRIVHRLSMLLGGNILDGGYIQWCTFIAFFWAMFEIKYKYRKVRYQKRGFKYTILPTDEKHILLSSDMGNIYEKAIELEKRHRFLLIDIIKKACSKFRLTNSISEVIEIISIQIDVNKEKSESNLSHLRYLIWVIPSIGFIGTVLGISSALFVAETGDLGLITGKLSVAFDTTLISLILSIIVNFKFHGLLESTDRLHADLKEYVLDNLINRIEVKPRPK